MNCRGADHRGVVAAVDGEADELGGAVGGGHREAVDMGAGAAVGGTAGEELHGAVGDRIGVAAVRRQHQAAEIAGRTADGGLEMILAGVDIADRDRADRGERRGRGVFGNVVNCRRADHGDVVGAVNGDGDELAGGAVAGDRGEAVSD